jgi:hypothetical protein
MEPLFNPDNVKALLGHLQPGSLAHDLVTAATAANAKDEAASTVALILGKQVDQVRVKLNGDS